MGKARIGLNEIEMDLMDEHKLQELKRHGNTDKTTVFAHPVHPFCMLAFCMYVWILVLLFMFHFITMGKG